MNIYFRLYFWSLLTVYTCLVIFNYSDEGSVPMVLALFGLIPCIFGFGINYFSMMGELENNHLNFTNKHNLAKTVFSHQRIFNLREVMASKNEIKALSPFLNEKMTNTRSFLLYVKVSFFMIIVLALLI